MSEPLNSAEDTYHIAALACLTSHLNAIIPTLHQQSSYAAGSPAVYSETSSGSPVGWPGPNGNTPFLASQTPMSSSDVSPMPVDSIATEQRLSGDQRTALHRFVKSISKDPVSTLGLPKYETDVTLTDEVNSHIRTQTNNIKGQFKKKMDTAASSRFSLGDFTAATLKAHRMRFIASSTVNDTHKAVFSNYLQRDVAFRLLEKQRNSAANLQAEPSSETSSDKIKGRTLRADSGY
ncbi:hypothetical protein BDV93DRAFT_513029 [Ceratobasidium sp. AG-I]|nr:hypothetical protein BDV93DRAFT_513029 [Ceratobasidium sp. AG-I]